MTVLFSVPCSTRTTTSGEDVSIVSYFKNGFDVCINDNHKRRGRGQANGVCIDAVRSFKHHVKSTYICPGELAGRIIFATISPGKRQGRKLHLRRVARLRRFLKSIAEDQYPGLIGIAMRMAFSKTSKIPHYHILIFLPQEATLDTCQKISDTLFTEVDRRWRQIHQFGISKNRGWCLLNAADDVKKTLEYACRDEANTQYVGSWGQTCFFYGKFPEPPAETFEVTPEQARIVIGILLHIAQRRIHPWRVNVVIEDMDPQISLMAIHLAGIPIGTHLLDRFRVPW